MRRKRSIVFLTPLMALIALMVVAAPVSAGRAWCRADPVLTIDGDVVDIQVSSSLEMYQSATGPIKMVVKVERGTRANVLLQDFGFGKGYDITVEKVGRLPRGVRAEVAIMAPADNGSLPVGVHGTRVGTSLSWLFSGRLDLLWVGDAYGSANEWVVLQVR